MPYPLAKQAVELSEGSLLSWIPFSVRQKAIKQALQIGKSPLIAVERDQFTVGAALRHRVQDIVERDRAAIGLLVCILWSNIHHSNLNCVVFSLRYWIFV